MRLARKAEVDRVMAIERATSQASHWSRAIYEKYVDEREKLFHRCLLVAESRECVIGFVAGSFLEGDETAVLESLVVEADWRRKGIATSLCVALLHWARGEGASAVELEVRAANEPARAVYAGLGFVERGLRRRYYSDPEDDAVLMALKMR